MRSICFYSSYFEKEDIPYYIRFYLDELSIYFPEIVFLTNEKKLNEESKQYLASKKIQLKLVSNEGWDFGMWYKALQTVDVSAYQKIALVNDSSVLFSSLNKFMDWEKNNSCDFLGMTESNAVSRHLQSYFLILKQNAIVLAADYFKRTGLLKNVEDVIQKYEIGLSKYLLENGIKMDAFISNRNYFGEFSPYYKFIDEHIEKGIPLIKKKIIFSSYRKKELPNLARMNFNTDPEHYISSIKAANPAAELMDFEKLKLDFDNQMSFPDRMNYNLKRFFINAFRSVYSGNKERSFFVRAYNKGVYYINFVLGSFQSKMESVGIIKPVPYETLKFSEEKTIKHNYPESFKESDKALFHDVHHYDNYLTSGNIIFKLENVCISYRGIVFKKLKPFVPAMPHPIFRNTFGWLYLLKQMMFRKKLSGDPSVKYLLLYDHWSMVNYYHWIMDSLGRLMLVKDHLDEYTILLPDSAPRFVTDSLSYFGIRNIKYIKKDEYLHAPHLYVQQYMAGSGHQDPDIIKEMRKIFLEQIPDRFNKKLIYISRSRKGYRTISNENDVIELVGKFGFEIIHFEDHSFAEQVQIMRNAKICVTSHGANLTNILFLPTDAKVLELIKNEQPNFCYWSMSSSLGLKYYYQLCKPAQKDNIYVDMNELESNLKLILNK